MVTLIEGKDRRFVVQIELRVYFPRKGFFIAKLKYVSFTFTIILKSIDLFSARSRAEKGKKRIS